jgi:hypothetical protein
LRWSYVSHLLNPYLHTSIKDDLTERDKGERRCYNKDKVLSIAINGGDEVQISRRMLDCLVHPEGNVRNEEVRVRIYKIIYLYTHIYFSVYALLRILLIFVKFNNLVINIYIC